MLLERLQKSHVHWKWLSWFAYLNREKKLESVPLVNDVIRSRIVDISFLTFLKHVVEALAASPYPSSMQLDGTTDISQCGQLLVFACYVHGDAIKEKLLSPF